MKAYATRRRLAWTSAFTVALMSGGAAFAQTLTGPASAQADAPMPGETAAPGSSVASFQEGEADPSASSSGALQEIIVTAQKRSENLQKVPIAVTVVTSLQLEAANISGIEDLKIAAPGVEMHSNQGYSYPVIRGVGSRANGPGIEPPIAIYIDGVYYGAATSTLQSFNNVAQVEVLKGPQGTLFGRNATGGLIQITTKDPSQSSGGEVNVSFGNFKTLKADAYVTGAISENVTADLAIAFTTMGDGYGSNLLSGRDIYKIHHDFGARSKWRFKPTETMTAQLIFDYFDSKSSMNATRVPLGQTIPPPFGPVYGGTAWDTAVNVEPLVQRKGGGLSLRIDQELGAVNLASITAYRKGEYYSVYDFDYGPADARRNEINQKDWQFSQELQLQSDSRAPFSWLIGAYYYKAKGSHPSPRGLISNFRGVATPLPTSVVQNLVLADQGTDSISGFGQANLELTEKLKATIGLRFTSEERSLVASQTSTLANGTVTVVAPPDREVRFHKLTWRLALDYQFQPDVLGYVSYNRGFKSGGFNSVAITLAPFQPEVLDAYEIGLKTTFFDRRVRLNVAGYFYDYQNVQVQRAVDRLTGIYNAEGAEIYGADFELNARLTDQLDVNIGYQYAHGRYKAFPGALIAVPQASGGYAVTFGDVKGNTTVYTPESTLSVAGNYTVPLGSGDLNWNVTYYYNSGSFEEPDNVARQPSYNLLSTSLRWQANSGLSVSLWAENLTNAAVQNLNGLQTLGAAGGQLRASYAPPRTYGITIGQKF